MLVRQAGRQNRENRPMLYRLEAYWRLEEASGNRADAFGANTLTDNNTVTQDASGKQGSCALFTAANSEYLSIADNAALSTGDIDFTAWAWVKFTTAPASNMGILSKYGGAGNREWSMQKTSANRLAFQVSNDGTAQVSATDSSVTVTAGVWYLIIGWHNSVANTISIQYNNNTPVSTAHTTGVFDSANAFNIGRFGGSFYLDGVVDEVGFIKRLLSAAERTWLYNSGNGRSYAELVAFSA